MNLPQKSASKIKKDKFDIALENSVNLYIETLGFDLLYAQNPLVNPILKKNQTRNELMEKFQNLEFKTYVQNAFELIKNEGARYLDADQYKKLLAKFNEAGEKLDSLNLKSIPTENFQSLLNIDEKSIESLKMIGSAKFQEQDYEGSIAIYYLLTLLNPENLEYLFRIGMTAQKSANFDLALRIYESILEQAPEFMGAKLFSIECYLKKGDSEKALLQLTEAKSLVKQNDVSEEWIELLKQIESTFY